MSSEKDKPTEKDKTDVAAPKAPKDKKPSRFGGLKFFLALLLTAGLVVGGAAGMKKLEVRVQQGKSGPVVEYVGVKLEEPPSWMPEDLGKQIAQSLLPEKPNYSDSDLLTKVQSKAAASPWFRSVQFVTRQMSQDPRLGLVVVKAEYRQPWAKVKGDQDWLYLDMDGFRLPESQVPRYMAVSSGGQGQPLVTKFYVHKDDAPSLEEIHYIEVQGVSTPPPAVGQRWAAEDVAEGLKLVGLLYPRPYARQISIVDVRNHAGRINRHEPFLRLQARTLDGATTDIRFGQFPSLEAPVEIPTDRKLQYLDQYAQAHRGFLAGRNRYIDLRYDSLVISND